MRIENEDLARALWIARVYWDIPVRVRLKPYVEFIRRLDGELEELETRWAPAVALQVARRRTTRR